MDYFRIRPAGRLVEGVDYIWEGDRMVLTREFLLARGFCCNSLCKNCPWRESEPKKEVDV